MIKYLWIILLITNFFLMNASATTISSKKEKTSAKRPLVTKINTGEIVFPKGGLQGQILKIISVKSYQYIKFKDVESGRNLWVASANNPISAGDQINIPEGNVMSNFYGAAVNMYFDFIIFAEKVDKIKKSKNKK